MKKLYPILLTATILLTACGSDKTVIESNTPSTSAIPESFIVENNTVNLLEDYDELAKIAQYHTDIYLDTHRFLYSEGINNTVVDLPSTEVKESLSKEEALADIDALYETIKKYYNNYVNMSHEDFEESKNSLSSWVNTEASLTPLMLEEKLSEAISFINDKQLIINEKTIVDDEVWFYAPSLQANRINEKYIFSDGKNEYELAGFSNDVIKMKSYINKNGVYVHIPAYKALPESNVGKKYYMNLLDKNDATIEVPIEFSELVCQKNSSSDTSSSFEITDKGDGIYMVTIHNVDESLICDEMRNAIKQAKTLIINSEATNNLDIIEYATMFCDLIDMYDAEVVYAIVTPDTASAGNILLSELCYLNNVIFVGTKSAVETYNQRLYCFTLPNSNIEIKTPAYNGEANRFLATGIDADILFENDIDTLVEFIKKGQIKTLNRS